MYEYERPLVVPGTTGGSIWSRGIECSCTSPESSCIGRVGVGERAVTEMVAERCGGTRGRVCIAALFTGT